MASRTARASWVGALSFRNPMVCPKAKSTSITDAIRYSKVAFMVPLVTMGGSGEVPGVLVGSIRGGARRRAGREGPDRAIRLRGCPGDATSDILAAGPFLRR